MQLFEAEELTWEKVKAASVELEEDATQWPRQVLTELFRALPEISEYTPEVKFIKNNEEQGYAIGVVVITNGTNSALAATSTGNDAPKALVPLVIKNGKLSPLDTLMASSGKMYPLTVDRLREVLYRPETFDLITDDWGDAGLWQLFAPPGQGLGGQNPAGAQVLMGPGMKQAALLDAIDGTILDVDVQGLARELAEDNVLAKAAALNPAMRDVLLQLAEVSTVSSDVEALQKRAFAEQFPIDVFMARYLEEGDCYELKVASRATGLDDYEIFERGDFLRFAGAKLAERVDREGSVVAASPDGRAKVVVGGNGQTPRPVERSGYYTVYNAITGVPLRAWVFTGLVDVEGNRLPIVLVANDQGATTQDDIVGTYSGERAQMPRDPVRGQGCFVLTDGEVGLHATVPVTVQGSTAEPGAIRYRCTDLMGQTFTVVLQRGMEGIVAFPARKELILPYYAGFVSTERALPPLVARGEELGKVASSLLTGKISLTAVPGEERYHFGLSRLPKLAARLDQDTGRDLAPDDALFALCFAGLGTDEALSALHKVAAAGRCDIECEDLRELPSIDTDKLASRSVEIRALRPHLIKEAAVLPDTMTVDAVLGLDFINSENVRVFISMIPYLEKALNKICELVFASRLGLSEIPETAAARAARGLNDAIRGLKGLALRQIDELP